MALAPGISNAVAILACDAIVDACDGGTGAAILRIYSGAIPADVDTAASGTLLGTLVMSDPAFGAASDNTGKATASASAITSDTSADASDTAGYYRVWSTNDGATPLLGILQGTAGVSGDTVNLVLDDKVIVAGGTIAVSGFTVDVNENG